MKSRRVYRRRRPRAAKRRGRRPMRIARPRVGFGMPKSIIRKLKYNDDLTGTIISGGNQSWIYQNSVFDPLSTAGGHQPMFFDQLAAIYQNYRVYGIAYKFQAITETALSSATLVGYANTHGATYSSSSNASERTWAKNRRFTHQQKGIIKGYMSVAKVNGQPYRTVKYDDKYASLVTGNPTALTYQIFQVFNDYSSTITYHADIELIYYVEFFNLQNVSQS